jgi:hypothetical protein
MGMTRAENGFAYVMGALLGVLALCGCATGSGGDGSPPPPSSITIKSIGVFYSGSGFLSGTFAIAGQGDFSLLVNGTGFTSSAIVNWNGSPLPTMFGDSADLAATVSEAFIAAPGKATITVSEAGATSNAVALPIASPAAATAGVIALISVAPDGSPANGDSIVPPSISATGRYVAFQSNATNLVAGPASGFQEIYERDTCMGAPAGCTPSTVRITATYNGAVVNGHSRDSAISADGRYVAFDSSATNILANSSVCGQQAGLACVFLRDTCIGAPSGCTPATFAVSVDVQGGIAPGGGPQMTPDGRFVSFGSSSSALGLGTGTVGGVFLRDTCIGAASGCNPSSTQVSLSSSGSEGNANSQLQAISAAGRYVSYLSWATNMVPNATVVPGWFWRDTCLGVPSGCSPSTSRVDESTSGQQANQPASFGPFPAITADGRLVAFGSGATNLVATNSCTSTNGCGNVYVRDTCTRAIAGCTPGTSLVSLANDGSVGNCFGGGNPANQTSVFISADGRFVSFGSISTNLTPDDTLPACSGEDIFVRDTCFAIASGCVPSTVRVSVANTPNPGTSANAINVGNTMSEDGHYVAFISSATNFLPSVAGSSHAMVYLAKTGF